MGLNLLDLDCILISKEIHNVEINGERKTLTTDKLFSYIHSKELNYAELFDDSDEENPLIYIKLNDEELMLGVA